jgi:hypothetical protein
MTTGVVDTHEVYFRELLQAPKAATRLDTPGSQPFCSRLFTSTTKAMATG